MRKDRCPVAPGSVQTVRMCFDNFTVQVCTVQVCSQSPVPFFVDTNRASLSWSQISGRDRPGSGSTASSRDKESACRPYALRCYVDSVRNVRYITNAGGSSLIATVRCGDASQATHPKWRSWRRLRCCAALALNIVGRTSSFHFIVVSFHVGQCTKIPARCQCRREGV